MPVPLWRAIDKVMDEIGTAQHLWIGLDFDGTLAPHVDEPDAAHLDPEMRVTIRALGKLPHVSVALISGRSEQDVRERVGIEGLTVAGNHGLEISGSNFHHEDPTAAALRPAIDEIAARLRRVLDVIPGALVECKGLSLSVHYRLAASSDWERIAACVRDAVPDTSNVRIRNGALVWEILPAVAANKGSAVRFLTDALPREGTLPIYLGDDLTDEDAFQAIPKGITVLVGETRPSYAQYCVANPAEVHRFLKQILENAAAKAS